MSLVVGGWLSLYEDESGGRILHHTMLTELRFTCGHTIVDAVVYYDSIVIRIKYYCILIP